MTTEQRVVHGAGSGPDGPLSPTATSAETAIVHAPSPARDDSAPVALDVTARIPIEIDVAVPIRDFRIRKLLALAPGQVIATRWLEGEDMPLGARGTQLAWTEFEVIDQKLAVRITRLT